MESSNPTKIGFKKVKSIDSTESMTIVGTMNKTMFLLVLVFISSILSWNFVEDNPSYVNIVLLTGVIGGLFIAILTCYKLEYSMILAPLYAMVEGLALGPLTMLLEIEYPAIGIQAVFLTVSIFVGMLLVYGYRIIKVTDKFFKIVSGLTFGILIVYLISIIARFFGMDIPLIHEGGIVGIGFSLFVIAVASMNLLLDFRFIEDGQKNNIPKYMEWFGAFSLTVTIIWLYVEVLNLLAKLKGD